MAGVWIAVHRATRDAARELRGVEWRSGRILLADPEVDGDADVG